MNTRLGYRYLGFSREYDEGKDCVFTLVGVQNGFEGRQKKIVTDTSCTFQKPLIES